MEIRQTDAGSAESRITPGEENNPVEEKHYSFFQNRQCEYFPCHQTKDPDNFNCLFCYCPLYALGKKCGGNFRYNDKGFKDCTHCLFPHRRENYEKVAERYGEIMEIIRAHDAVPGEMRAESEYSTRKIENIPGKEGNLQENGE